MRGLKEEEGFNPDSRTETYAAITCEVATRRWAGVPFYLRHGKRLGRRVTEIAVIFKRAPHLPFDSTMTEELGQNAFVIRVQPDEGVTMRFGSKVPGSQMEVRDVTMDFGYGTSFTEASPEAYERLILDVLLGEPSLFPVNEEVERSWEILDPVIEHWQAKETGPDPYPAGSWGPESAKRDAGPHRPRVAPAVTDPAQQSHDSPDPPPPDRTRRDRRPAVEQPSRRSTRSWSSCARRAACWPRAGC